MARVTYLGSDEAAPPRVRRVMVRRGKAGECASSLRGNNLAGAAEVLFLASGSDAGLADAIARANNYAEGCRIDEIFVRDGLQ
jgi:hypothetical protein